MTEKTQIQQYLERRPRYWRLWRLTKFEEIKPEWAMKDLLRLYHGDGVPELLLSLVLNSFLTHKRRIAIISSNDLAALASHFPDPRLERGFLGRRRGGKSLYQGFLFLATEELGLIRLLNEPKGKVPGVYELVGEPFAGLLPSITDEDRSVVIQAANLCRGGK